MSRLRQRLSDQRQHRDIVKQSKMPWQPMTQVPEEEWPAQETRRVIAFWKNNKYLAMEFASRETSYGPVRHLIIQKTTGERIVRWGPLQRIKNEVAGPDAIAVELYPAERDVIEDCHVYHLWLLPEGYPLPGVGIKLQQEKS